MHTSEQPLDLPHYHPLLTPLSFSYLYGSVRSLAPYFVQSVELSRCVPAWERSRIFSRGAGADRIGLFITKLIKTCKIRCWSSQSTLEHPIFQPAYSRNITTPRRTRSLDLYTVRSDFLIRGRSSSPIQRAQIPYRSKSRRWIEMARKRF